MSRNLKTFINVMDALLKMIVRLCPDDRNVKVGYEYFVLGRSANPMKIWELFIRKVYPMKGMIVACDEDFFLCSEVNNNTVKQDGALQSILQIKDVWISKMTDIEKERVWKALNCMISISNDMLIEKYNKRRVHD